MSIFSVSDWCRWGVSGLDSCVEGYYNRLGQILHPEASTTRATEADRIADLFAQDIFERPARVRDTARINALKQDLANVDAERVKHARAYRTAEVLCGMSFMVVTIAVALFSSPFTVPLAMVFLGGGVMGMLTFWPKRGEEEAAARKLERSVAILEGQLKEAER